MNIVLGNIYIHFNSPIYWSSPPWPRLNYIFTYFRFCSFLYFCYPIFKHCSPVKWIPSASIATKYRKPVMLTADKQIASNVQNKEDSISNGIHKGNKEITHRTSQGDNTISKPNCVGDMMISRPNSQADTVIPRPNSISTTRSKKWYEPLMELASPFSPVSPSGDPFLYARVLFSVAKCSSNFNRATG